MSATLHRTEGYSRDFRPMPAEVPELTLAPVEFHMPGFERRIAPVTKQELEAMDRVRFVAGSAS